MSSQQVPEQGPPDRRHLAGSILSVGASRGLSLVVDRGSPASSSRGCLDQRGSGPTRSPTRCSSSSRSSSSSDFRRPSPTTPAATSGAARRWRGGSIGASFLLAVPGAAVALTCFALLGDSAPGMTWPMAIALRSRCRSACSGGSGRRRRWHRSASRPSPCSMLRRPCCAAPRRSVGAAARRHRGSGHRARGGDDRQRRRGRSSGSCELRAEPPDLSPPGGMRAVLRFGLPAWGSELLMQLNLRVDLVLVGVYAGAAAGGRLLGRPLGHQHRLDRDGRLRDLRPAALRAAAGALRTRT